MDLFIFPSPIQLFCQYLGRYPILILDRRTPNLKALEL